MAERKTGTSRKPAAKKVITPKVAEEPVITAEEVISPEDVGTDKLAKMTVPELRFMHDDALKAESEARRLVYVLRQRAANAPVEISTAAEEDIIDAKKDWAKAVDEVRHVEKMLENEFKDIYGMRF